MGLVVHLLESGLGYMGIDLGRREAFVTQQFLDHAQVRPAFEQVRGVGVAQGVGIDVPTDHSIVENPTHVARTQS